MGQSGAVVHDFRASLAYSQTASDEPFWDAVYRKAFPNIASHTTCDMDCQAQRQGIDRVVVLQNGEVLKIDEKKRTTEYADILLEYLSNDKTGALGWIEKDQTIDYLAYAFMNSRRVYLFPWLMLRRAWLLSGEQWKKEYKIVPAKNSGYTTYSVAVPILILQRAMRDVAVIQV